MEEKEGAYGLRCTAKKYDKGLRGEASAVGWLYAKNTDGGEVNARDPYAELWMGTHPVGPSYVAGGEGTTTLKRFLEENPSVLGEKSLQRWGTELPFLFKVLSVGKALSIQAHPDKEMAKKLHEEQPSVYRDGNHKPEMALALTHFQALCGFITLQELKIVLKEIPEIEQIVGAEAVGRVLRIEEQQEQEQGDESRSALRSIFTRLMSADEGLVSDLVCKLETRLKAENQTRGLTEKEQLALVLARQYPADVGVLASFFLNYVKLNPGEALYLGPNEPHAYVSGECVECMATSDNVVRAGLTPKYRDVATLCSILTYSQGLPEVLRGKPVSSHVSRYAPPFDEFEVDICSVGPGEKAALTASPGPAVLLLTVGGGKMAAGGVDVIHKEYDVSEGHVFFVPAAVDLQLTAGPTGPLRLYRAGVNSRFFQ
ncbi:mannose-6-phosphate isomerase 2-like isoform X2 [Wolffia australiana]